MKIKMNFYATLNLEMLILNRKQALVLGAKGSGKSALFQMFARYEDSARKLSGLQKNKVLIVTGTGFNDIKELQTDDFTKLLRQEDANFDYIWELYIAVKIAIKFRKGGVLYRRKLNRILQARRVT